MRRCRDDDDDDDDDDDEERMRRRICGCMLLHKRSDMRRARMATVPG